MHEPQKVFFLGASKMGTSSIHQALKDANCRSVHNPRFSLYSHLQICPDDFFTTGDFFLDGSFQNFRHLKRWFPNAKFVLLDRDPQTWTISLFNWFRFIDQRHMGDEKWIVRLNQLFTGRMATSNILETWLVYRKRVLHAFSDQPNFLHIDIERHGERAWKALSEFVGVSLSPRWENVQSAKEHPQWLNEIVAKASKKAALEPIQYPDTFQSNGRFRAFNYINRILLKDFYHERHLSRNLKACFNHSPPMPFQAVLHLSRFLRMTFLLALRFFIIPGKIVSPFVV